MDSKLKNNCVCPIDQSKMSFDYRIMRDWRRPDVIQSYDVFKCDRCKYKQIFPRPTQAEIKSFYQINNYYTHFSSANNASANINKNFIKKLKKYLAYKLDFGEHINSSVFTSLDLPKNAKICDLGCGNGTLLEILMKSGYKNTIGVEIDDKAREICRQKGLNVLPGTAEELPEEITKQKFDVVVMSHVLEHCINPVSAINNVSKIINKDGFLILEVPNNECYGAIISGLSWPWLDIPRHLNFFSKNNLLKLIKNSNLSIVKIQFAGYFRQFSDEWEANQNLICDNLGLKKPSKLSYWLLLLMAITPKNKKYDSIRITAINKIL